MPEHAEAEAYRRVAEVAGTFPVIGVGLAQLQVGTRPVGPPNRHRYGIVVEVPR